MSDEPRIHLLSGLLAGGAANGATHLQHGLRKAGVNSSLHYPASLRIGDEIIQLQQDGCQPLTWNLRGLDKLKRKISHRIDRQMFKRRFAAGIRDKKFSHRPAERLTHLGRPAVLSLNPTISSTYIGLPNSSTTPAFSNLYQSTSQ